MKKSPILKYLNFEAISLLIGLLVSTSALTYYFYALNKLGVLISLIAALIIWLLVIKDPESEEKEKLDREMITKGRPGRLALALAYLSLYLLAFFTLVKIQSGQPLISPWEVVPGYFWLIYIVLSLVLIKALSSSALPRAAKIIGLSLHYFLSFSVALIVYQINYGFDPFIHQATLELIAQKGLVLPKPLYYLGDYGLIIVLNKVFGLPIYWLNRLLVPLLAASLLPVAIFNWLESDRKNQNQTVKGLVVLGLLILPFSGFIISTPQNLAYIFLILTIFSSLHVHKNLAPPLIWALATFAVHPLAGLAAGGFLAFWLFDRYQEKHPGRLKASWKRLLFVLFCLSWPLALYFSAGGRLKFNALAEIFAWHLLPTSFFPNQENLWLNFTYFFNFNQAILIIIVLAWALWRYRQNPRSDHRWNNLLLSAGGVLIAWCLSRLLNFDSLISYEQDNFTARLLVILVILSLPFIIEAGLTLASKILKSNPGERLIWTVLFVSILSASFYSAYPRRDNYFNSRGYATSQADWEAVNSIAKKSRNDYLVLANQQTSAAALQALGFDHYYQTASGPLYFYPIPTSGPLYQYYLEMVYKNPERDTMLRAMDLVGVNEAYFVIDKYWKDSQKIIELAKPEATAFWPVAGGQAYVFFYQR